MKLIVGLGNPGRKYVGTRHNVGFRVAAGLAEQFGMSKPRGKFRGEYVDASIGGQRVIVLCPHTYMNRSGFSVRDVCDFFQIDRVDVLVVCDDFNLPVARLRFRGKGSAGGQKGLQDVIRALGTDQIPRLRLGVGAPPDGWDVAAYVLSKFAEDEVGEIDHAIARAVNAAADWCREGMQYCMNQYNAGLTAED